MIPDTVPQVRHREDRSGRRVFCKSGAGVCPVPNEGTGFRKEDMA